jgi:hypothetical protein
VPLPGDDTVIVAVNVTDWPDVQESLAEYAARLEAGVIRFIFTVMDFHHLLLAGFESGALEIIGPPLHHLAAFGEVFSVIIDASDLIALNMGELTLNNIAVK